MPPSKRSSKQTTSDQGLVRKDPDTQKTISELFSTSKKSTAGLGKVIADCVPPNKRIKISHPLDSPSVKALTPAEMYNFPSSSSKRTNNTYGTSDDAEVIDLTGSPHGGSPKPSPTRPRPGGTVRATALKPQNGPRKLFVKNLKKAPQADPEQYYKQVWKQLDAALSAIFADERMPYSYEELYKGVESLCRQDHGPAVYRQLRDKCKHNVSVRVLKPFVERASTANAVNTLDAVVTAWSTWTAQLVSSIGVVQNFTKTS